MIYFTEANLLPILDVIHRLYLIYKSILSWSDHISLHPMLFPYPSIVFLVQMQYHESAMQTQNAKQKSQILKLPSKRHIRYLVVPLLLCSVTSHFPLLTSPFIQKAHADTVSNDNYSIDVNDIDTNPQPTPKPIPQVLGTTTQPISNGFTTGPNYTVNASNDSFSVDLSQTNIDYGILSATNPVIRTSQFSLVQPENGAEVLTYENHPLQSQKNAIIPDTSCDNGSCTPSIAALWSSTLTYGFGYRCDSTTSNICDIQFLPSNTYKPYPDISHDDTPTPLGITPPHQGNSSLMVTYKVTVSGTQKTEGYSNTVTYLAIPNF